MIAVCYALSIYRFILLIRILATWFPPPRYGSPLRPVLDFMIDITDPVLRPIRNMVPPVNAGAMAVDLSPIIVFVLLTVIQTAIGCGVLF
ncbi:MAG: YggT family protein [Actinomycetota bacterium]|jgi:YggT family protein